MVEVPRGGVIAHRTAQYVLRGVVRNTGLQPIRSITLTVRVRVGSSVSMTQVVTVYNLPGGASDDYGAELVAEAQHPRILVTMHITGGWEDIF